MDAAFLFADLRSAPESRIALSSDLDLMLCVRVAGSHLVFSHTSALVAACIDGAHAAPALTVVQESRSEHLGLEERERALADRTIAILVHLGTLKHATQEQLAARSAPGPRRRITVLSLLHRQVSRANERWLRDRQANRAAALSYAHLTLRTIGSLPSVAWCLADAARLESEPVRQACEQLPILLDIKHGAVMQAKRDALVVRSAESYGDEIYKHLEHALARFVDNVLVDDLEVALQLRIGGAL